MVFIVAMNKPFRLSYRLIQPPRLNLDGLDLVGYLALIVPVVRMCNCAFHPQQQCYRSNDVVRVSMLEIVNSDIKHEIEMYLFIFDSTI